MGFFSEICIIEGCYQMISCRPVCPEIAAGYGMLRMKCPENQISQMKTFG